MIIRSQDKRKITNFSHVADLVVLKNRFDEWEIIACYPYFAERDCGYSVLATYSSEEKALKVLDMFQSYIGKDFRMPSDEYMDNI